MDADWEAWALGAALFAAAWAAGCGSDPKAGFDPNAEDNEGGGPLLGGNADGSAASKALTITPPNPVLTVTSGGTATQQFKATPPGSSTEISAIWSVDNVALGTIDNAGLFKASGTAGGQAAIIAQAGNLQGQTTVTVKLSMTENPGNIDAATQTKLQAGGTGDPAYAWLYPYDATVFPRGLLPPTLQFAGQAATATYVHITSKNLDYKGYFAAGTAGRVALPAATWKTITASAGANDPLNVEVTKISGAAVAGPIKEAWTIAQGNLKGTVYYNTYNSPLANGQGAVMRVKPGASADILSAGCTVCHAVSASGNVLVAMGGPTAGEANAYTAGVKIDLTSGVSTPAYRSVVRVRRRLPRRQQGPHQRRRARQLASERSRRQRRSRLCAPRSRQLRDARGDRSRRPHADAVLLAGRQEGGIQHDKDQGHTLAVLDFNNTTNAFTGLADVVTDPASFLGWPAFMPDTKSFTYGSVSTADYATWQNNHGDLFFIDIATKTKVALDAANGMKGGASIIPYGTADLHLNYEPTALPIAVGGYYWVVFTSRRQFGNTIVGGDPWSNSPRKKLWVVAIDMNPAPGKDPSHPAFYLEGQEQGAGNMRGFWALDPCKQNGNSCESGDECCNGFCRQVNDADGGSHLTCVQPPTGCANEFEKCNVAADCCGAAQGVLCIAGHCATPGPK